MALFTKGTKTRVSGMKGNVGIKKFFTAPKETSEKAITIRLTGEDQKTYSITLYGQEVEYLEHMINKAKYEQ